MAILVILVFCSINRWRDLEIVSWSLDISDPDSTRESILVFGRQQRNMINWSLVLPVIVVTLKLHIECHDVENNNDDQSQKQTCWQVMHEWWWPLLSAKYRGWWGCLWILDCRKQAIKEVESDIMFRMSGRNTLRKLRKEGGWGSMPSEVFEPLEAALAVLEEDLKNDKKDS